MIFAKFTKRQDYRRTLEVLHCHEQTKIVDVHCRFLVRSHFRVGCVNLCRVSGYSNSLQFR